MSILSQHGLSALSSYATSSFQERMVFALTDTHKKIIAIAALAFGFLACCYWTYRSHSFKEKPLFGTMEGEYEGEYGRSGQRQGSGKFTFADGSVYVGKFLFDTPFGQGKLTLTNKDVYEGRFLPAIGSPAPGMRAGFTEFSVHGTCTHENGKTERGVFTIDKTTLERTEHIQ